MATCLRLSEAFQRPAYQSKPLALSIHLPAYSSCPLRQEQPNQAGGSSHSGDQPVQTLTTLLEASIIFGNCQGREHRWPSLRTYSQGQNLHLISHTHPLSFLSLEFCPDP